MRARVRAPLRRLVTGSGEERADAALTRAEGLLLVGTLAALVLVNVPLLGSAPWEFRPGSVDPRGPLAFVVRGVGGEWDVEAVRAPALLGGVVLAVAAAGALAVRRWRAWPAVALAAAVVVLLVLPAVVLQAGLRQSTAPWFFTNDSTFQMEIAGELLRDGVNPYGHDYRDSGLERFYSLDGSVAYRFEGGAERPSFDHFLYFPGPAVSAAAWTLLPRPWEDYRFLVVLATFGSFLAALAFPGRLAWRLAAGAVIAANPLAVRAAWFGVADATSIVFLVLAFALLARARWAWAAALLGAAVLFKQFALVAVPFFAVVLLVQAGRREALRSAAAFGAVVAAGILPFLAWDPAAFWADTVPAGDESYQIVGAGLASVLVEAGVIEDRTSSYPFLALLVVLWLPLTIWLLRLQLRSDALWTAAAGFAASVFVFVFLGRVLQPSYLVWPLTAIALAALLAAPAHALATSPPAPSDGGRPPGDGRDRGPRGRTGRS